MGINQVNDTATKDVVIQLLQSNTKQNDSKRSMNVETNMINVATNIDVNEKNVTVLNNLKREEVGIIANLGLQALIIILQMENNEHTKKKIEKNFHKVFDAIDRNYNAINNNYHAIKNVEERVDRNFVALQLVFDMVTRTLSAMEETRLEMHQEFNRVLEAIKDLRVKPTISKLNNFIQYFVSEEERIKDLPRNEHIAKLQEQNSILLYLKDSRTPSRDSLRTPLYDIISQEYAIPQDANDETAFRALYALHYGTQIYVSVMFFLLEQYSYLADYHYQNGDIEKYNEYIDSILISFRDFKYSLVGNNESLIYNVIDILRTVKEKSFIKDTGEHSSKVLSQRIDSLTIIKHKIKEMELPIIADSPVKLTGRPEFNEPVINTPIGEWKDGAKVSYAVQYRNNGTYSKLGEWSDQLTVSGKANPFLRIPVDPKRRTRLIFRKFNNDKSHLAGVLEDKYQIEFRDINRDLYNAALSFNNEHTAINEVNILIHSGADINALFDKGRKAIHAAVQGGNRQLVQKFLISNNFTDINAKDNNGYTPIHIAAETGHNAIIELLTKYGADINARTTTEQLTPLHIAAYKGYNLTIKVLMTNNAIDVNARDKAGFTPLHSAVIGGVPVIQALMSDNSTDVNAKSKEGLTPLHLSSINNYLDITEILLGSDKININARAKGNLTALHFASMAGNVEIVKFLTSRNETDVNAESINNLTPLHLAITLKKENVVSELLKVNSININIAGEYNITPLHIAAITGQEGIVLDLLEKGVTITEKTKNGLTALHLAFMYGNEKVVSTLIDNGANIDATMIEGSTPLHLAAQTGYLELVKYLIDNKDANFNIRDKDEKTPLQKTTELDIAKYLIEKKGANYTSDVFDAAKKGYLGILKYLVVKGANINSKDQYNYTALHKATEYGKLDVIKYLIDEGINIDANNNDGYTPLHLSVKSSEFNVTKYLIENGANVNVKNIAGDTPLHEVAKRGQLDLVKYLIDNGADVDARNDINRTPLHMTVNNAYAGCHRLDTIKYLIHEGANIHAKNNNSGTVLHEATAYNAVLSECAQDIVKYLIEDAGANTDINIQDNLGRTALYYPVVRGKLNLIEYLIENGADVNVKDQYDETLIEKAIRENRPDIADLLKSKRIRNRRSIETKKMPKRIAVLNHKSNTFVSNDLSENNKINYNVKNNNQITNKASRPSFLINNIAHAIVNVAKNISQSMYVPCKPLIEMKHSLPSKTTAIQDNNINGTLLLLDTFIRKITGQKHISTVYQSTNLIEARACALNITEEFKKVVKQAAKDSVISLHRLISIDFLEMQEEITGKIMNGNLNKIPGILNLYAEKACPSREAGCPGKLSPKKFNKFMVKFNKGLEASPFFQFLINSSTNQSMLQK